MNKPSLNLEQSEKKKLNEKHSYYMAWSMRHHHFCIITHHSSNPNTFYIITYRQLNNLQRHSFVHSFKTHVKKKVFPWMMCAFVCETTNIPFLCFMLLFCLNQMFTEKLFFFIFMIRRIYIRKYLRPRPKLCELLGKAV